MPHSRGWAHRRRGAWGLRHRRYLPLGQAFFSLVLAAACVAATLFVVVDARLRPTLLAIARTRATTVATGVINRAVSAKLVRTIRYDQLYNVRTDSKGKIVLLQPNTGEINRLAADVAITVQDALRTVGREDITVPLAQVLGSPLLATTGPTLTLHAIPTGTVGVAVQDRFEQAGINQTRHKIYLRITACMRVLIPMTDVVVQVSSELPVTEAVILGEVPQMYFGSADSTFSLHPGPARSPISGSLPDQ